MERLAQMDRTFQEVYSPIHVLCTWTLLLLLSMMMMMMMRMEQLTHTDSYSTKP